MNVPVRRPAPRPCSSCPYRRDVPSGVWAAEEYRKLVDYDAPTGHQPTGLFLCHQQDRDSDQPRLCGGWVATHGGHDLLALRLAPLIGTMTPSEVEATVGYATSVPLFGSGAEAAAHGVADIEQPGPEAQQAIDKIARSRGDLIYRDAD